MKCNNCGSKNITTEKKKVKSKKTGKVTLRTIATCEDCGSTWYIKKDKKKRKTWLWVLGWLFIFPLPLTILLLRKRKMKPVLKYCLIIISWIVYLVIVLSMNATKNENGANIQPTDASSTIVTATPIKESPTPTGKPTESPAASPSNGDFIKQHQNEFIAAAKLSLDNYLTDYTISLAPQRWTIAKFDETDTIIGMTTITYNGSTYDYTYVGTLNIDESGETTSVLPHYIDVGGHVFGDDGYCDNVFNIIKGLSG